MEVLLPDLPEQFTGAKFIHWLIKDLAPVEEGTPICEVEADKIAITVHSAGAGILHQQEIPADTILPSGSVLATITDSAEPVSMPPLQPVQVQTEVPEEIDFSAGPVEHLGAMRTTVARRMTASKLSAPHFYLTSIVDMTSCIELRARLKKEGVRVSYNDMIIKAAGLALREFPRAASVFSPEGYVPRDRMHVGFAVAVEPDGLVVPVVRDADRKTLAEITADTRRLVQKTRAGTLTPADYAQGVFSISNLGGFDVDQFTAIVNPGEAAILAIGKVTDTPCVAKKEVTIRPLMKITLSSDHRVIDGVLAARFNGYVKKTLQDPDLLTAS